ncbi:MAG: putative metallophosphoesterase [Syntrophaceae bacterium PtaU1.Bin231]|nr:MAG: putative metallophosphoesterase [Syntrophaceae bacterium PtaU1.Bin231]
MIFGLTFSSLRLLILSLAVLSQIYLFYRVRKAIRSLHRPHRFKRLAIPAAGVAMVLLFAASLYIVFKPIPWVYPPTPAQVVFFYPPAVWGLGSIFSALLLLIFQLAGGIGGAALRLLRKAACRAAAPPFGRSLRVVQLTDIHAGLYMNREQLRCYADKVISLQPDLFVLTGDYVSNSLSFLPGCLEEMTRIRAPYGTFATLGNHEHWYAGLDELREIFRKSGIPLLNNEHRVISTERGPFAVAGIDDLRNGDPDLDAALRGLDRAVPTLLLSHRPEIFPEAAGRAIPLTLSGHYHGGQIKIGPPGAGISLAHLRTPYPEGLYRIGDSRLYVSRGIGTTFTPVRLNAPPEVTVIQLT